MIINQFPAHVSEAMVFLSDSYCHTVEKLEVQRVVTDCKSI